MHYSDDQAWGVTEYKVTEKRCTLITLPIHLVKMGIISRITILKYILK